MKFKSGDKVRFLNDIGGGVVNRVDDKGFVYVQTDDGFEIPVTEKDLVFSRNFAYTDNDESEPAQEKPGKNIQEVKSKKEKPIQNLQIPQNVPANVKIQIMLGFIPEISGPVFASNLACYLINDSPFFLYYLAGRKEGGSFSYLGSGYIEADTKALLDTFDQTTLSKISDLHVQILLISKGRYIKRNPIDTLVNLNLVNFSKESYFRDNEYFEEKAVIFRLTDNQDFSEESLKVPDEIKEIKMLADQNIKPKKKEPVPDTLEVDLHFEEDMQNSQLIPSAILALQMSRFHSAVEEAISKNLKRLVVIHGLGQGILKMQIRKELQEKYPGFIYQDASFKEYGFGATMVHLIFDQKQ